MLIDIKFVSRQGKANHLWKPSERIPQLGVECLISILPISQANSQHTVGVQRGHSGYNYGPFRPTPNLGYRPGSVGQYVHQRTHRGDTFRSDHFDFITPIGQEKAQHVIHKDQKEIRRTPQVTALISFPLHRSRNYGTHNRRIRIRRKEDYN